MFEKVSEFNTALRNNDINRAKEIYADGDNIYMDEIQLQESIQIAISKNTDMDFIKMILSDKRAGVNLILNIIEQNEIGYEFAIYLMENNRNLSKNITPKLISKFLLNYKIAYKKEFYKYILGGNVEMKHSFITLGRYTPFKILKWIIDEYRDYPKDVYEQIAKGVIVKMSKPFNGDKYIEDFKSIMDKLVEYHDIKIDYRTLHDFIDSMTHKRFSIDALEYLVNIPGTEVSKHDNRLLGDVRLKLGSQSEYLYDALRVLIQNDNFDFTTNLVTDFTQQSDDIIELIFGCVPNDERLEEVGYKHKNNPGLMYRVLKQECGEIETSDEEDYLWDNFL